MTTLTVAEFKASIEFKKWITGIVHTIHDMYSDGTAFIVIHSDMGKHNITRFFHTGSKLNVSVDHTDLSSEEVFNLLLTQYSNPLD